MQSVSSCNKLRLQLVLSDAFMSIPSPNCQYQPGYVSTDASSGNRTERARQYLCEQLYSDLKGW